MKHKPEDHMGLVHDVVKRLAAKNMDIYEIREDVTQEGMVALCEACGAYSLGRVEFSTYAVHHIHNRIVDYLRWNENKFKRLGHIEDTTLELDDDDTPMPWEETVAGSLVDSHAFVDNLPEHLQEFVVYTNSSKRARDYGKNNGCSNRKYYELKQELADYLEIFKITR